MFKSKGTFYYPRKLEDTIKEGSSLSEMQDVLRDQVFLNEVRRTLEYEEFLDQMQESLKLSPYFRQLYDAPNKDTIMTYTVLPELYSVFCLLQEVNDAAAG
jgi:hypothetical protein